MPHVVFLRGINVGGHRAFRPALLAKQLAHLDVVNIGAAGTFVVKARVAQSTLRAEFRRRLPFDTEIAICRDTGIVRLMSQNFFAGQRARADVVRFVSVLSRRPRSAPRPPVSLPSRDKWLLKILAYEEPFVVGLYRRQMKVIRYIGALDEIYGVPVTTRSWSTIVAVAKVLERARVG
jgi:uncharacterized protein (DUF1697 family)